MRSLDHMVHYEDCSSTITEALAANERQMMTMMNMSLAMEVLADEGGPK